MSSYSEVKNDAINLAGICVFYYALVYGCCFFPACIISLQISRWFSEDPGILFVLLSIAGSFGIVSLIKSKQYFIVLVAYLITLWPFLYIVYHYCVSIDDLFIDTFPLPLDWCFLW
jgi:hypothetical protein